MESSGKSYFKKESFSDIESSINSKFNYNDSLDSENLAINEYDFLHEKICCVEMINNNKVFIKFKDNWTVKDVNFFQIFYKKFYNKNANQIINNY